MIDFACKKLDLNQVIRCSLGITKTEQELLNLLLGKDWVTAGEVEKSLSISLATAQRSLKNLHEKELIERRQQNLDKGGYLFFYKAKDKEFIKSQLRSILKSWMDNVDDSLNAW